VTVQWEAAALVMTAAHFLAVCVCVCDVCMFDVCDMCMCVCVCSLEY